MILERLGIGFQIERNLWVSLSQIPTVEEEEQRGVWLLFFEKRVFSVV
jgi:hypothetical protein